MGKSKPKHAFSLAPADHFDTTEIRRRSDGSPKRLEVTDIGYEARAVALLQVAYAKSFLNQPLLERVRSGMRSYAEKKWTAGGKAKVATQALKYAVAGAAFATLAAVTGPGVVVILGVGLAATILTKAGSKGIDKFGTGSVADRLKKSGDPDPLTSSSPSDVMPIVHEHGGVTIVIEHLFRHWSDIRLMRESYSDGFEPADRLAESYRLESVALSHFKKARRVEEWKNWEDGEAGRLEDFSEYFSALDGKKDRAKNQATKKLPNKMSMTKVDVNFMRLKVKKLTFYCACIMDYCSMTLAEHALMHEAMVQSWAELVALVRRQAHIRSDHTHCHHSADGGCFGGLELLEDLVDEEFEGLVEIADDPAPATPPPDIESIADRGQTIGEAADWVNKIRRQPGRAKVPEFVQKEAAKRVIKKGMTKGVKLAKGGGSGKGVQWPSVPDLKLAAPNAVDLINSHITVPVAPCIGELAGDLTDFIFQHFDNLGARDRIKTLEALTRGLQKETVTLKHCGEVVTATILKGNNQNEAFFREMLPAHEDLADFKKQLIAAANKIEHYVKKSDRRRQAFLKVYEPIVARASDDNPAHCVTCQEASKLAYLFFNLLKTMWKLEQHVMFLHVFAKGVASGLKDQSDKKFYFPFEASENLANWFEFWHDLQPSPPTTTPSSEAEATDDDAEAVDDDEGIDDDAESVDDGAESSDEEAEGTDDTPPPSFADPTTEGSLSSDEGSSSEAPEDATPKRGWLRRARDRVATVFGSPPYDHEQGSSGSTSSSEGSTPWDSSDVPSSADLESAYSQSVDESTSVEFSSSD